MNAALGLDTMIRLILRRDRLRLPLWIIGLIGINTASVKAVRGTYGNPEAVASYGPTAGESAASRITSGRQTALDTIGGIAANETTLTATLGVTLMVIFLVVRHTRAEEESGAAELLRSGVLGRHTSALAAVLVATAASVLVGVLHAASYAALGLDVTGALAFGAEIASLGILFTGIAVAAAQVAAAARGALATAGAILGATYVLRGIGAVGENWVYWLSPFGWAQGVDAYGDEQWWLLGVVLMVAVVCFGLAVLLAERRDVGAGLTQPRPGPARASRAVATSPGLTWRTQRGLVIGWAIGLAALAAVYGSVIPEIPDMLRGNPEIADAIGLDAVSGSALIDGFLSYLNVTLGVIATAFGVSSVLRLRQQENSGQLETLFATRQSRTRLLGGSLLTSGLGIVAMGLAMGVGIMSGYVPVSGDTSRTGTLLLGLLAQLPAVLLVAGLTFLILGWLPRLASLGWLAVAWVMLVAFLAETLKLPRAVRATSPFDHLPAYPTQPWTAQPALVLIILTAGCLALGLVGYRRRDVG